MLNTSLLQEHSRERSPLGSPLRLGHLRRNRTPRVPDPSWAGGGGGLSKG